MRQLDKLIPLVHRGRLRSCKNVQYRPSTLSFIQCAVPLAPNQLDQIRTSQGPSARKRIANDTLKAIEIGSYTITDSQLSTESFDLRTNVETLEARTLYYGHNSVLSSWTESQEEQMRITPTPKIWAVETSTLETARWLVDKCSSQADQPLDGQKSRAHIIGVLNFSSAKNPGGGFLRGAQAQVRM